MNRCRKVRPPRGLLGAGAPSGHCKHKLHHGKVCVRGAAAPSGGAPGELHLGRPPPIHLHHAPGHANVQQQALRRGAAAARVAVRPGGKVRGGVKRAAGAQRAVGSGKQAQRRGKGALSGQQGGGPGGGGVGGGGASAAQPAAQGRGLHREAGSEYHLHAAGGGVHNNAG